MRHPPADELRKALPKEGRLVLCTHRHPDPDGLGALAGLRFLLEKKFGLESDLVLEGRIRRAENVAMRDLLDIRSLPKGGVDPDRYVGVFLVDAQPGFTHVQPPGALPLLGVVDHHHPPTDEDDPTPAPFVWIDADYGSTSTMVHHLLQEFDCEPDQRVATALFCGVRYDTNDLLRDATPEDEASYHTLHGLADLRLIASIDHPELPRDYFRAMAVALEACQCHGSLLLALMGEVPSPEMVAEVADWFVRLEGQQWSLAGGACDGRYQLSVRTDMPAADAYPALRYIVGEDGSCGGHGRMAGGQILLTEERTLEEVIQLVRTRALEVFDVADQDGVPLAEPQTDAPSL